MVAGWITSKTTDERQVPCTTHIEILQANKGKTASIELHLAKAYVAKKRYDDAEKLALHSYDIYLDTFGGQDSNTQQAAGILANLYERRGELEKTAIWNKRSGETDP